MKGSRVKPTVIGSGWVDESWASWTEEAVFTGISHGTSGSIVNETRRRAGEWLLQSNALPAELFQLCLVNGFFKLHQFLKTQVTARS